MTISVSVPPTFCAINRTELCECSFSAGPYFLAQTMLSCQNNAAAATGGSFSTYYVFRKNLLII